MMCSTASFILKLAPFRHHFFPHPPYPSLRAVSANTSVFLVNFVAKWQLIPSQTDLVANTPPWRSPPLLPPTLTLIPCSFSLTSYSWSVPFPILLELYVLLRSPSVCLSSGWKSHIHVSLSHSQSPAAAVIQSNEIFPWNTHIANNRVSFIWPTCASKCNKANKLLSTYPWFTFDLHKS